RPAGSAFKPFVLAAAVHQGISLHKLYSAPQTLDLPLPRGGVWHVRNFEDEGGGTMDLVQATIHSINTVYARLILEVGPVEAVDQVRTVLEEVVQRGTGVGARIGRPVAGKTGTGEQWRDAWFVGFTPELVTSVWVGFPDAQRSMVPPLTRVKVQGGTWPAQIWQLYMSAALAQTPV